MTRRLCTQPGGGLLIQHTTAYDTAHPLANTRENNMTYVKVQEPKPAKSNERTERCTECGRRLRADRSLVHGRGPCCQAKHLDSLPPERQEIEKMAGYGWFRQSVSQYIVVTPEHNSYSVDLEAGTCTCIAFEASGRSECKHIHYLQRETGWGMRPTGEFVIRQLLGTKLHIIDGNGESFLVDWSKIDCNCGFNRKAGDEVCVHIRAGQDFMTSRMNQSPPHAEVERQIERDFV